MSVRDRVHVRDIEGIRVGLFGTRVNTTSFLWRHGSTIIDTGPPNQWGSVRAFISEQPVDQVVVSHHHEDHAGNLARLPRLGINRLLAPRESLRFLEHGFPLQLYRRIVWGRPRRLSVEPFSDSIMLANGQELEPILLTGHSPDMTCLLDRDRGILFGADLYVGTRIRYLRRDENLNGILTSLERALTYDFDTLLCSHRGILQPAHEKLKQKLEYLLDLRARARTLAGNGHTTAAIVHRLLGPEDSISRMSFGHFSKHNLVRACLAPDGSTGGSKARAERSLR